MASGKIIRHVQGGLVAPANEPCDRCGVRADVGCKHRAAAGVPPLAIATAEDPPKRDGRRPGNGNNFHRFKPAQSLWGKAGNPTESEFARYVEAAKKSLGTRSRDD